MNHLPESLYHTIENVLAVERPFLFWPSDMTVKDLCEKMAKQEHTESYKKEDGHIGFHSFHYHGEVVLIYNDKLYHVPFSGGEITDCSALENKDICNARIKAIFPLGADNKETKREYYVLLK